MDTLVQHVKAVRAASEASAGTVSKINTLHDYLQSLPLDERSLKFLHSGANDMYAEGIGLAAAEERVITEAIAAIDTQLQNLNSGSFPLAPPPGHHHHHHHHNAPQQQQQHMMMNSGSQPQPHHLFQPPQQFVQSTPPPQVSPNANNNMMMMGQQQQHQQQQAASTPAMMDGGRVGAARFQPETQVIAKLPAQRGQHATWILATVVRQIAADKWEVRDDDPGDEWDPNPEKKHFTASTRNMLSLPNKHDVDWETNQFRKGTAVMAMFPRTTSFYPAIVVAPPKKRKAPEYLLRFEDDEEEAGVVNRVVPAWYVVIDPAGN